LYFALRAGYTTAVKNGFLPFFMNLNGTRHKKHGANERIFPTIQIKKPPKKLGGFFIWSG
jgi:hypothetical protein